MGNDQSLRISSFPAPPKEQRRESLEDGEPAGESTGVSGVTDFLQMNRVNASKETYSTQLTLEWLMSDTTQMKHPNEFRPAAAPYEAICSQ